MSKIKYLDIIFVILVIASTALSVYGVLAGEKVSPFSSLLSNLTILLVWGRIKLKR